MLVASDCFQPEIEQLAEGFLTAAGQQAHGDDMPLEGSVTGDELNQAAVFQSVRVGLRQHFPRCANALVGVDGLALGGDCAAVEPGAGGIPFAAVLPWRMVNPVAGTWQRLIRFGLRLRLWRRRLLSLLCLRSGSRTSASSSRMNASGS